MGVNNGNNTTSCVFCLTWNPIGNNRYIMCNWSSYSGNETPINSHICMHMFTNNVCHMTANVDIRRCLQIYSVYMGVVADEEN